MNSRERLKIIRTISSAVQKDGYNCFDMGRVENKTMKHPDFNVCYDNKLIITPFSKKPVDVLNTYINIKRTLLSKNKTHGAWSGSLFNNIMNFYSKNQIENFYIFFSESRKIKKLINTP